MEFDDFKNKIVILDRFLSDQLRLKYIDMFVNCEHPRYHEQICVKHKFKDGYCYLGYLWDFMKNPIVIDQEYIESKNEINEVYVMWDNHSCERIWIKDYWKFDKNVVLKLNFSTLLLGYHFLPEDIYIFDDSFSWTFVLTHEELKGKRYCLKCGEIDASI